MTHRATDKKIDESPTNGPTPTSRPDLLSHIPFPSKRGGQGRLFPLFFLIYNRMRLNIKKSSVISIKQRIVPITKCIAFQHI